MLPFLYSPDQLPHTFSAVRTMTLRMADAAIAGQPPRIDIAKLPETAELLADVRFLLAVVAAPGGEALLHWQELENEKASRADCLARWIEQGRPNLARLLPGCAFEWVGGSTHPRFKAISGLVQQRDRQMAHS